MPPALQSCAEVFATTSRAVRAKWSPRVTYGVCPRSANRRHSGIDLHKQKDRLTAVLRNPIRCFDQAVIAAAFLRFVRQPNRPNAPKSGSAAGSGVGLTFMSMLTTPVNVNVVPNGPLVGVKLGTMSMNASMVVAEAAPQAITNASATAGSVRELFRIARTPHQSRHRARVSFRKMEYIIQTDGAASTPAKLLMRERNSRLQSGPVAWV